ADGDRAAADPDGGARVEAEVDPRGRGQRRAQGFADRLALGRPGRVEPEVHALRVQGLRGQPAVDAQVEVGLVAAVEQTADVADRLVEGPEATAHFVAAGVLPSGVVVGGRCDVAQRL